MSRSWNTRMDSCTHRRVMTSRVLHWSAVISKMPCSTLERSRRLNV